MKIGRYIRHIGEDLNDCDYHVMSQLTSKNRRMLLSAFCRPHNKKCLMTELYTELFGPLYIALHKIK